MTDQPADAISNPAVPVADTAQLLETAKSIISEATRNANAVARKTKQITDLADQIDGYATTSKQNSDAAVQNAATAAEQLRITNEHIAATSANATNSNTHAANSAASATAAQTSESAASGSAQAAAVSAEATASSMASAKINSDNAIASAEAAKQQAAAAQNSAQQASESLTAINQNADKAKQTTDAIVLNGETASATLKEIEKNSKTAKTSSEDTVKNAATAKTNAEGAVSSAEQAKIEFDQAVAARKNAEHEAKLAAEAHNLSTTAGLAGAFNEKAKAAVFSMYVWSAALLLALLSIFIMEGKRFDKAITLVEASIGKQEFFSVLGGEIVLSLFTIAAPLWFAWMSTRMISKYFHLSEDYSYKAALSKAYIGFKEQATGLDPIFEERLFASAITQLDANPLRFFEGDKHPASPMQDLFQQPFMRSMMRNKSFKDEMLNWMNKTFKTSFNLPDSLPSASNTNSAPPTIQANAE